MKWAGWRGDQLISWIIQIQNIKSLALMLFLIPMFSLKWGASSPVSQNPLDWACCSCGKTNAEEQKLCVREGVSEEKRTRAVPASECHHEEGERVSNTNLKIKWMKEKKNWAQETTKQEVENAQRRELCPTGPDERLDVITSKKERAGERATEDG